MKGGARPGAGRPKAAPTTVVRVRLNETQHAAWVERGGDVWLKRVLNKSGQTPTHSKAQ